MVNSRWAIITRRATVVVGLICLPALSAFLFDLTVNRKLSFFLWGASSYYGIIAVWLVARHQLFQSAGGLLRVTVYLACANYGWMLGPIVRHWLSSESVAFPIPGTDMKHFGNPILSSLETLTYLWLFMPLLYLSGRRLFDRPITVESLPTPGIRGLLIWTAIAAIIVAAIRVLTLHGKPIHVYMAHYPLTTVITKYVGADMPVRFFSTLSICVIMAGLSGRCYCALLAVSAAAFIQFTGQQSAIWVASLFDSQVFNPIAFSVPWNERVMFCAGNVTIAFVVFALARLTGLRFLGVSHRYRKPPEAMATPFAGD